MFLLRSGCLPSKTISQMNLQTQRLLGQQSLAEFMGLHVYLDKVFLDNAKKTVSTYLMTFSVLTILSRVLRYSERTIL